MSTNLGAVTLLNRNGAFGSEIPAALWPSKLGATHSACLPSFPRRGCALPNTEDDSTTKPFHKQQWERKETAQEKILRGRISL